MYEKIVEISTADGRMETFICHPEQGGPFAPVVLYMDVWGLRQARYRRRGTPSTGPSSTMFQPCQARSAISVGAFPGRVDDPTALSRRITSRPSASPEVNSAAIFG
jgi:hypothetical protein